MTSDPQLSQWEETLPFARLLGLKVTAADPQQVVAELQWRSDLCTSGGTMHGGVVMSLADTAGAILASLNLPTPTSGTTTISSSTQFIRGIRSGTAVATARLLHRGRTTIVVETDVTASDGGKLLARVTQTQAVLAG
ncbi:MAG: PaaI family thioesterase [Acidimicrobiales bacterium]